MMLAYVGPESIAPVASAIAAFFGFLLIGWRWIGSRVKRVFRFVFRISPKEPEAPATEDPVQKGDLA